MFLFSSRSKSIEQKKFEIKVKDVHRQLFLRAHQKNMKNENEIYLVKYLIFLKIFYTNTGSIKRESTVKDEERMILHDFYEASPEESNELNILEIQKKVDEIYMFVQPKASFMRSKPSFLNNSNESENENEKKKFTLEYNNLNLNMNSFLSCAIKSI